jgi:hypothetical protein
MELIKFDHANMRDEKGLPVPITVVKEHVFSWYYSTSSKCSHIVSTGGSVVPVLAKPDEINKLMIEPVSVTENKQPIQGVN